MWPQHDIDAAFRRHVAVTGQSEWSKINASLHTIYFIEIVRRSKGCDNCLSATHRTFDCYATNDIGPLWRELSG